MQEKTLVETWVIVAVFPGSSHAHACTCISMPSRRESWSETDWTLVFDTEQEAERAAEEFGVYEGADSLGATDVFTFKCSRVREVSRETVRLLYASASFFVGSRRFDGWGMF